MREKSEVQSHLAANVRKLEHSVPSRSVESEPGKCAQYSISRSMFKVDSSRRTGDPKHTNFLRFAVTNRRTSPAWSEPADSRIQSSRLILVHVVHLQLNGETCVLENKETKNVNFRRSTCRT